MKSKYSLGHSSFNLHEESFSKKKTPKNSVFTPNFVCNFYIFDVNTQISNTNFSVLTLPFIMWTPTFECQLKPNFWSTSKISVLICNLRCRHPKFWCHHQILCNTEIFWVSTLKVACWHQTIIGIETFCPERRGRRLTNWSRIDRDRPLWAV